MIWLQVSSLELGSILNHTTGRVEGQQRAHSNGMDADV